ncbi:MFS transporter [Streptomyces sp. NPDC021093]|uniref:MFS transporter n=1 Tax=Streptomyces sp. NPDC021093 TaxID=3365112 RepID=UPI003794FB75
MADGTETRAATGNGPSGNGSAGGGSAGDGPPGNGTAGNSPSTNGTAEGGSAGDGSAGNSPAANGSVGGGSAKDGSSGTAGSGPSGNGTVGNGSAGGSTAGNSPSANANGSVGGGSAKDGSAGSAGSGPSGNGTVGNGSAGGGTAGNSPSANGSAEGGSVGGGFAGVDGVASGPGAGPHPVLARSTTVSAFVLFFTLGATTASLGASLPLLTEHFGTGHDVSRIVTWYNLGALVAVALLGLLGRRLPPRTAIGALLALFVVGAAGMAASPTWTGFAVSGAVCGSGYGGLALMLNTAFAHGFAGNSVVMVNRLNAVFGVGAILGPMGVGAVGRWNIQLFPLVAGVLALACLAAYRCGAALSFPRHTSAGARQGKDELTRLRLGVFLAIGLLYAGLETSIGAWQTTQLVWSGWSESSAAQAGAGFWGGIALGRLIIPYLAKRLPVRLAIPLYLAAALGALLAAAVPYAAVFAYPLAGIALAPILPTLITWISHTAAVPQRATSLLTLSCMLGNTVVPACMAITAQSGRPATVALSLAAVCALCLGTALVAHRLTATRQPAAV